MSISQKLMPLGDGLGIALARIERGEPLTADLNAVDRILKGHKVALLPFKAGEVIKKFQRPIGVASADIVPGQWVHDHNLAFDDSLASAMSEIAPSTSQEMQSQKHSFQGFDRGNGRVGTRNYVGIISTVNCSGTVCRIVAERANKELLSNFPKIDGFVPIVHQSGCGMANYDMSFDLLQRTLKGYINHPNFGAVMVIGLGCEVNQIGAYAKAGDNGEQLTYFNMQQTGGTAQTVESAFKALQPICSNLNQNSNRTTCDASHIILGLQCGGSDGFSGISANPALGRAVDLLVHAGGTAILSETPEILGAEPLLLGGASAETKTKLTGCVKWWQNHARDHGISLDNNPSPGNKAGGLTTILEKSLGAVSKAGTTPLNAYYDYAQKVTDKGLVFMDSPGYDPVSATGQIAAGANLIAFTTGRGSCFGAKPAPSFKLASTSELFTTMEGDMDIDCGTVLDGRQNFDELGEEIFNAILAYASGQRTKSELLGYGDDEFIPWRFGAVL